MVWTLKYGSVKPKIGSKGKTTKKSAKYVPYWA